ncbi:phage portal protein [Anoxybacillus ayderensis]|uniref:phage portal protein n=1 Tax=Anoxybacillus ayderensis TaxID=265546 RepID=UPI000A26FCD9|nr:phage portal protein [Anoxybacillus ayderensis]OSX53661.1 portal protein [Anoxybacillus ayderensis]
MGLWKRLSGWFKRSKFNVFNNFYWNYGGYVTDENILQSSDIYNLMKLISDQIALTDFFIEDEAGKDINDPYTLQILRNPNQYLTEFEMKKLIVNTLLIRGKVYIFKNGNEWHVLNGVYSELLEDGSKIYSVGGVQIPAEMIVHVKNIGTNHLDGVGLLDLARQTLEGVMNAENSLTDKYRKGGLLAYLLKLDTHIAPNNQAQNAMIMAILDKLEQTGQGNKIQLIPLSKGYEIEALQSPVDDEKIIKYLSVYKKDLGKFFGVDLEHLLELQKTDMEQFMMMLYTTVLRPIIKNLEQHLSKLFFPQGGRRIRFKINPLDYVTMKTKTDIAYNLVRTSIASPNDAREMLGFDRLEQEEAKKLYISKDLIGLDNLEATLKKVIKGGETP